MTAGLGTGDDIQDKMVAVKDDRSEKLINRPKPPLYDHMFPLLDQAR